MIVFILLFVFLISCISTIMILDFIKTTHVSMERKVGALFIDIVHNIIVIGTISLFLYIVLLIVFQNTYNIILLLVLLVIELIVNVLFFKYKRCVMSIAFNRILDIHPCIPYVSVLERYRFNDIIYKFTNQTGDCKKNMESFLRSRIYVYIVLIALVILYILKHIGCSNKIMEIMIIGGSLMFCIFRKNGVEHFHVIKTETKYLIMPTEIYDDLEVCDDDFMMERPSIWFEERLQSDPNLDYQAAIDKQFNNDIEPSITVEDSNYVNLSSNHYELIHIDDTHEEYDIVIIQRPGKMYGVAIRVDKEDDIKRWINPMVIGFVPDDKINILVDNGKHLQFDKPVAI